MIRPRHFRRILALALPVLVAAGCAFPRTDEDRSSFPGTYYVNGVDQAGIEYGGHLTITETGNDSYEMQWIITGSVQVGTATESQGELIVDWQTVEGFEGDAQGTGRYRLTTDGELRGERWITGETGVATEEGFPVE